MMKPIRRLMCLFSLLAGLASAVGAGAQSLQEQYIRTYAPVAVSEMYRSGVPASITLAQGLLESRYGQSVLATGGNNHFGIKCHDWSGKKMYHDDDAKGECFRVYGSPEESFRDHSDFLRYRDRYKFLFENETTDYKAWAYGLKKAGYATDPAYPQKLIKYIEDYQLYKYDKMTLSEAREAAGSVQAATPSGGKSTAAGKERKRRHQKKVKAAPAAQEAETIPQSPLSIEEPKKITPKSGETFRFPLTRQLYSRNGVPFLYAVEGETYESIANAYHLFIPEILKFNDLETATKLDPGTIVYLQAKKKQSAKDLDMYIVDHDGESLWEIAQRFGVRLASIREFNGFPDAVTLREGDQVLLRSRPTRQGLKWWKRSRRSR